MSFRTVQLNISHSLHIIQFWVSLSIPTYCKKRLLWWGIKETLICEHRRMQILHRLKKVPALREGSEHRVPLLTKKLSLVGTCWQRKNPCFAMECHWIEYNTNVTKQMTSMVFLWTFVSFDIFLSYWSFTFSDFHLFAFCCNFLVFLFLFCCVVFCFLKKWDRQREHKVGWVGR